LNPTARRVGWGLSALLAFAPIALAQSPGPEEIVTLLAKGPARGAPNAPVTIIELSDFQCSFCGKFWKETLPRLEAEYVRPGKVRLVYRHLAILGTQSVAAAQAADCAGEQGKFWEYHDLLFRNQAALAREIELDYAAIAVVVNHAAGRGASARGVSLQQIEEVLKDAMGRVRKIIEAFVTA